MCALKIECKKIIAVNRNGSQKSSQAVLSAPSADIGVDLSSRIEQSAKLSPRIFRYPRLLAQASGRASSEVVSRHNRLNSEKEKKYSNGNGAFSKRKKLRAISENAMSSPIEMVRFEAALKLVRNGSKTAKQLAFNVISELANSAYDSDIRFYAAKILTMQKSKALKEIGNKALYAVSKDIHPKDILCRDGGYIISTENGDYVISTGGSSQPKVIQELQPDVLERDQCKEASKLILSGSVEKLKNGLLLMRMLTTSSRNDLLRLRAAKYLIWMGDQSEQLQAIKTLQDLSQKTSSKKIRDNAAQTIKRYKDAKEVIGAGEEAKQFGIARYCLLYGNEEEKPKAQLVLANLAANATAEVVRFKSAECLVRNGNENGRKSGLLSLSKLAISAKKKERRLKSAFYLMHRGDKNFRQQGFNVMCDLAVDEVPKAINYKAASHLIKYWDESKRLKIATVLSKLAKISTEENKSLQYAEYAISKGDNDARSLGIKVMTRLAKTAKDKNVRKKAKANLKKY